MSPDYRRYVPAAILSLGIAFIVNAHRQAAVKLAAPLSGILQNVPGYAARQQTLSEDERRVAGMSDYVARAFYRDSVPAFTTFVSYYERQTKGKTIHSPKNCLPGAGWEVMTAGSRTVDVAGKPQVLNRYLLKNGPATAVVYYWYQGRGRIVANEYKVKWNLLRDAAISGRSEEALARVVVFVPNSQGTSADTGLASADSLGENIASQLAAGISRVLPRS
jgi:EpsI family protein